MSLCGTLDLKRNYLDYGTLFDGEESFYIGQAEQWFLAQLNNFDLTPPNPDPAAGTYDFFVRDPVSLMAIYLCAGGYLRRETAIQEDNWWDNYRVRAQEYIDKLRAGEYRLSYQTSIWEHGISPAIPTANGTIAAPAANIMQTNYNIDGNGYSGRTPRTCIVELDGTGTTVQDQTFRWKWDDTADDDWEAETVDCDPPYWNAISYGLSIYFRNPETGTVENGMKWKIRLNPLDESVPNAGITGGMRTYG